MPNDPTNDSAQTPTPETDAETGLVNIAPDGGKYMVEMVTALFARTLERQRDSALAKLREVELMLIATEGQMGYAIPADVALPTPKPNILVRSVVTLRAEPAEAEAARLSAERAALSEQSRELAQKDEEIARLKLDAARYAFLRNFQNFAVVDMLLNEVEFNTLDQAVDARMAHHSLPNPPGRPTLVIAALKEAYANAHQCDLRDRCPGCMAGYALEAITGRKWTQEECESSQSELAQLREEQDKLRNIIDGGKGQSAVSILLEQADALRTRAEEAESEWKQWRQQCEHLELERIAFLADNVALRDLIQRMMDVNDSFGGEYDSGFDPNGPLMTSAKQLAASPSPGAPLLDAVETAAVALERISKLRWGDDGDGGSTVLAEDGLDALSKYRRAKE